LNPGSPAPQASVLIQTRLRALSPRLRRSKIVNTLIKLRGAGLEESTLKAVSFCLAFLAKHVDLDDSEAVKNFIATKKCANSYKNNLAKAYNYYAVVNGIEWLKPYYRYEPKLPKIPTTEQIDKLINSASRRYATILTLLKECGMMPIELSRVSRYDIDLNSRILHVQGAKGHNSRVFKLKAQTCALLKEYLAKNNREKPFPSSEWICKCYREHRNRIAEKFSDPALRTIRLYDFRHYYATLLYWKTKDILLVKQKLGHKKLETTLIYTQLVQFHDSEFTVRAAETAKEASVLLESGFEYVATTPQEVMLFRKRK